MVPDLGSTDGLVSGSLGCGWITATSAAVLVKVSRVLIVFIPVNTVRRWRC